MTTEGKHSAALMMLLATGCSAASGKLAIKAIPQPVSAAPTPIDTRIAEARGLLAVGSVGLALESFRLALRDDPRSVDALTGLASCYDRMGRFDLSRRYYEQALALQPTGKPVLAALAGSLDEQGKSSEAQSVRAEMSAPPLIAQTGKITVELPAPRPAAPPVEVAAIAKPTPAANDGPRLERMSFGEVALITTPRPQWKPVVVARTLASTTVRFVPIPTQPAVVRLRLLNAARQQGLAARTRNVLASRGWRDVVIGDADRTRDRSLVLYSEATAQHAQQLARRLGFALARDARPGALTILLGRDASARLSRS